VFETIAAFGVQSQIDYDRVVDMGVDPDKVVLTGNMKYDQNISDAMEVVREDVRSSLLLNDRTDVFIAGSTHAGEEDIVLNVFQRLIESHPRLVLILAPRHPERFHEVEKMTKRRGLVVRRKTAIDRKNVNDGDAQVILLDTIGELSQIYGIGDVILVGGSMVNVGGHNILEPVVHRKPVLFGPWMYNFSEVTDTIRESGAGIQVRNEEELLYQAQHLLNNKEGAKRLGEQGFTVFQRHQGATDRNMELINRFIEAQSRRKKTM
jgi:3-deoxy-D-manno-octulosonic-acid transferase